MKKRNAVILLLFTLIISVAGVEVTIGKTGVAVAAGPMGSYSIWWPYWQMKDGKTCKPVAVSEGDSIVVTYPAPNSPVIRAVLKGNAVECAVTSGSGGTLCWSMIIPIAFSRNGEYALPASGPRRNFPGKKVTPPIFADRNENSILFTDNSSGTGFRILWDRKQRVLIQDNREWGWNAFTMNFFWELGSEMFTRAFRFADTEKQVPKIVVDRFGQPMNLDYPDKVKSEEALKAGREADHAYYDSLVPPSFARYGAMPGKKLKATGFFRVEETDDRWIFVTPEGAPFFQLGVCCIGLCDDYTYVTGRRNIYEWLPPINGEFASAWLDGKPDNFSFYIANCIRKTGKPVKVGEWKAEALDRLKKWGFNSQGGFGGSVELGTEKDFPITPILPLDWRLKRTVGDLFDPFDDANKLLIDQSCAEIAKDAENSAIIGYFIGNEHNYSDVPRKLPALGAESAAKREFAADLREKYNSINLFNQAWQLELADFSAVEKEALPVKTPIATQDVENFCEKFFDTYFKLIHDTFRKYDRNHLLLGERFLPGMITVESAVRACAKYNDVFSINYYTYKIDSDFLKRVYELTGRPLLLSEWSFGTGEQGLAGGVVDVRDQNERGLAYRDYVEGSAALPFVIGNQWFSHHDQALTGRFFQFYNGEGMNIGLVNVADRPYREFLRHVIKTNYRIYDVVFGKTVSFKWRNEDDMTVRRTLSIPHALSGQNVDGIKSPWPSRPAERLGTANLIDGKNTSGAGADFWLCWDEHNLYLFAEVRTSSKMPLADGSGIELVFGAELADLKAVKDSIGHRLLLLAHSGKNAVWLSSPNLPEVSSAVVPYSNKMGYALEAAIPWNALGLNPQTGMKLLFNLILQESGDFEKPPRRFIWSGKEEKEARQPTEGIITLVD